MTKWLMALATLLMLWLPQASYATEGQQAGNGAQILEAFDQQQLQRVNDGSALTDHKKHLIMFLLGAPLLVLLLITGGLGIAMGVYGKRKLFVPHMLLAGFTMTLAIVHLVVGLVWFYPF